MFEETNILGIAKPPTIQIGQAKSMSYDSDEDSSPFLAKSKISLTSTVGSPLLMGRKNQREEEMTQEGRLCIDFGENGACQKGSNCLFEHVSEKLKKKNSFILENYPELSTPKFGKRILSLLS